MVVRDLLISFGAQLNKADLDKVEGMAKKSSGLIKKLFSAAFLIGSAKAALSLNQLASNVIENRNVLNNVFEDNAKNVMDWANTYARATGRSRYDMEMTAATLGAVLNPMMEKNAEAASHMSTRLAELAVDIGSMYNAADEDVMMALKSGLAGASMPLRRFGIVMTEATMSAFAMSQGIRKNIRDMSVAELTTLRYNFILDQTSAAHGDAAKTQFEWANSKKATIALLKDLATTIGLKLYPIMTRILNVTRQGISIFSKFAENSNILTSALIVLGGVVTAIGIKLLVAFWPVLLPVLKLAALVGILILLVDDFLTFLQGGDSVIGRFIDSIFGPGSAAAAVEALNKAFAWLKDMWTTYILPALKQLIKWFGQFLKVLGRVAKWFLQGVFKGMYNDVKRFVSFVNSKVLPVLQKISDFFGGTIDFTDGSGKKLKSRAELMAEGREAQKASIPTPQSGGGGSVNIHNNTTVEVKGNADLRTADKIADTTGKAQQQQNRRTVAAVRQKGKR